MEYEAFIDALLWAGWHGVNDAQHTKIKELWAKMFPVIAKLTEEYEDLEKEHKLLEREAQIAALK